MGALVVVADVTAEAETAKLRDAFIGVLSHELRTPITTIYAASQLLARPSLSSDLRDELIGDISAESDRLLWMVQNLLVIARIERGVSVTAEEPISLQFAIRRTIELERKLRPGVEIGLEVAPGLPVMSGDQGYLEQVLRNLISNGAMYGGGHLTVALYPVPGGAAIDVTDDGPGFPPGATERLRDLFWRGANAGMNPGAGIGLFVCKRLMEAMGGTIDASNRPGGGGRIVLTLPARVLTASELQADAPVVGG